MASSGRPHRSDSSPIAWLSRAPRGETQRVQRAWIVVAPVRRRPGSWLPPAGRDPTVRKITSASSTASRLTVRNKGVSVLSWGWRI